MTHKRQPLQALTSYHVAVCAIDGSRILGPTPSVIMQTGITTYCTVPCYIKKWVSCLHSIGTEWLADAQLQTKLVNDLLGF